MDEKNKLSSTKCTNCQKTAHHFSRRHVPRAIVRARARVARQLAPAISIARRDDGGRERRSASTRVACECERQFRVERVVVDFQFGMAISNLRVIGRRWPSPMMPATPKRRQDPSRSEGGSRDRVQRPASSQLAVANRRANRSRHRQSAVATLGPQSAISNLNPPAPISIRNRRPATSIGSRNSIASRQYNRQSAIQSAVGNRESGIGSRRFAPSICRLNPVPISNRHSRSTIANLKICNLQSANCSPSVSVAGG